MGVDLQGDYTIDNAWNYMVKLKDVNGDLTSANKQLQHEGERVMYPYYATVLDASPVVGMVMLHHWEEGGFLTHHAVPLPAGFPI